jgi:hypothetical protein
MLTCNLLTIAIYWYSKQHQGANRVMLPVDQRCDSIARYCLAVCRGSALASNLGFGKATWDSCGVGQQ